VERNREIELTRDARETRLQVIGVFGVFGGR